MRQWKNRNTTQGAGGSIWPQPDCRPGVPTNKFHHTTTPRPDRGTAAQAARKPTLITRLGQTTRGNTAAQAAPAASPVWGADKHPLNHRVSGFFPFFIGNLIFDFSISRKFLSEI